jgi:hypothetical protein
VTAETASEQDTDPPDLARWGLHCYAPTARRTPHAVVAEGDNGRLLYEARAGVSLRDLRRAGIGCTAEQLDRLAAFGLLERTGDRVRTAFPVLGMAQTRAARERLSAPAARTADGLIASAGAVTAELRAQGLGGSAYAVVFGHALDGLLWHRLAARGGLPDTALTPQRPWWNGAFWAVHPARAGAAGTNFVRCGGPTLTLVWTDATTRPLAALAAAPGVRAAVRDLVAGGSGGHDGRVTDADGREWRLRRPDGRPALPVLGTGGPVDAHADRLAGAVADALAGPDASAARGAVPGGGPAAAVVVAHEFIWEVAHRLTASGACPPPAALSGAAADPAALAQLLFLTAAPE